MYATYILCASVCVCVYKCSDFIIDKSDNSKFHCMPPMANFAVVLAALCSVCVLCTITIRFHPISIRQLSQSFFLLLPSLVSVAAFSIAIENYRNQKASNEFILKFIQIEQREYLHLD